MPQHCVGGGVYVPVENVILSCQHMYLAHKHTHTHKMYGRRLLSVQWNGTSPDNVIIDDGPPFTFAPDRKYELLRVNC